MQIIINGKPHDHDEGAITHEQICELAGEPEYASVTYRGPSQGDNQRSGTTYKGKIVAVDDGMIFNCVVTGNA